MITDTPVFRSTNQAIHVAYLIAVSPPTTKSPTQAVINDLMELAGIRREVEKEGTIDFSGLSPLEVRGQCAMVIAAVRHQLQPAERYAIEAYYAHDSSKSDGVRFLREWCAPHWTIESPQARMMIMWHLHLSEKHARDYNATMRSIEGQFGIPKSTVADQVAKVRKAVGVLRRHGVEQLDWIFRAKGLVGDALDEAPQASA